MIVNQKYLGYIGIAGKNFATDVFVNITLLIPRFINSLTDNIYLDQ
jgi:hypothetical protein